MNINNKNKLLTKKKILPLLFIKLLSIVKQKNNRKKAKFNNQLKFKLTNNHNYLNNIYQIFLNLWRKQKFILLAIITLLLILELQPIHGYKIIPQAQAINIIKQENIAPDRHIQFDITNTSVILYS
jgi:hypothetical protein